MNKKIWASKSVWVQVIGLAGSVLIGTGILGDAQWALYSGIITQVLGVIMRLITKEEVVW